MNDRQQAGASQPSLPQDAPGQTGKLNRTRGMSADAAGMRERAQSGAPRPAESQETSPSSAARANLRHLPTISGEPDAALAVGAPQGGNATLDQIFASEKEALKIESKQEKRSQRQADNASSQLVQALEQQAAQAQAVEQSVRGQAAERTVRAQTQAAELAQHIQDADKRALEQDPVQPIEAQADDKAPGESAAHVDASADTAPLPNRPRTARTAKASAGAAQKGAKQRASSAGKEGDLKKPRKRFGRTVIIIVVAILCVYLLGFSWNQWMRGDDEIDIQGVWQIAGSENTVTITQDYIQLTPDVKYPYTIDTAGKTITFTFADLSGTGRYRFSIDRNQLAIIEGPSFSTVGNTFSDIFWFGRSFFWWVFTQEVVTPGIETTEQRNEKEAAKQAQEAQEKAEEEKEAAEEEIKAASSSDYVLGSQLIKKAQAIKGIKSTTKKEDGTIDLPTECTLLIRTDQPVDIPNNEKPVMTIELKDSSQSGQSDAQPEGTQEKKPLIIDVPSASSGQSSGSSGSGSVSGANSGNSTGSSSGEAPASSESSGSSGSSGSS